MQELLQTWYPGFGEVEKIRRMSPGVQEFLATAVQEDPDFLEDYLLPTLEGFYPEETIVSHLSEALSEIELEEELSGDDNLGYLGKSLKKRIKKAVSKVKGKVQEVHKKVAEKVLPKPLAKIHTKAIDKIAKIEKKVEQKLEKIHEKGQAIGKKVWKKYGNIIIQVAGAVLAPFTGGASLAAASVLTAANTMYQARRKAQQAKKEAKREARQIYEGAAQQEDSVRRQVDDFYNQNQAWFLEYGVTPDRWAALTLDEKIELINAGAEGRLPRVVSPQAPLGPPPPDYPAGAAPPPGGGGSSYAPASSGGGYGPSGGGGGGGDGGYPPGSPEAAAEGQKLATAGMFGGPMLPLLAAGVVAALIFGKPVKGKGRTRRNPCRGRHRWRMRPCA